MESSLCDIDLGRMEEMARTMGRYGNNLEQLKREKSMLTVSYEVTSTYLGRMLLFVAPSILGRSIVKIRPGISLE